MRTWRFAIPILIPFCLQLASGCLLENGRSSVYLSVFEDAHPGENIGNIPVEGFKEGSNEIELRVVKGSDLVTVPIGSNNLKLMTALDRDEGPAKFEAVVECKSKLESDFSQLNISVFVTIKDVNDNAPEFDEPEYFVNITEELPVGTIVFTEFEATDRDQPGPNSFVQYSILPSEYSELLQIEDQFKPVITVKNRIDYEEVHNFTVQIEARDQGEPSRASIAILHVTVIDSNDLNPFFEHTYYSSRAVKEGRLIIEPSPIRARDGDEINSNIVYELSGELSSHFAIERNGNIRVRSNPPPPTAVFFVHAFEENNRDRNATAIVKVQLTSTIRFEHDLYNIKITSSTPKKTVLLTPKAYSQRNAHLKYSMSDTDGIANIEPTTGVIIMGELPMQLHPFYEFNITATDGEDSSVSRVHIFVDTMSDCMTGPKFDQAEYTVTLDALPLLGRLKVNTERSSFELLNMKRDFMVSGDGTVSLRQGAAPMCVNCELVVLAKDEQGKIGMTKVIVKNPAVVMSTSALLTILILAVLAFIFVLMLVFICRKVSYTWRQNKRERMCWLNQSTDSGVVITGTITGSNRYVVNPDKDQVRVGDVTASAKSPAPPRASGAHLVPVTVTNHDGAPTVYF